MTPEKADSTTLQILASIKATPPTAALFMTQNESAARMLAEEKVIFRKAEREGTDAHFQRLRQGGIETVETSSLHLDLLRDLKQINSHLVAAAAYPVLEERGELLQSRTPGPAPQAAVTVHD